MTDTAKAEEIAAYGLDRARLEALVTLTGGARLTLAAAEHVQGSDKKTFARRHEATFIAEVPESIIKDLAVKPADLLDKSLMSFDKEKVARVSFVLGDQPLTLERQEARGPTPARARTGRSPRPPPARRRSGRHEQRAWGLSSLKASAIVDEKAPEPARFGLDPPARTVTLFDEAGKELGALLVGKEIDGKVYAKNKAEPRIFELDKARLGELPSSRADLEEQPKPAADGGVAR